jgi:Meckel syndrome type 1 protein
MVKLSFLLISAGALLLAGCAAQGDFPSLAPRAAEGELSPAAACERSGCSVVPDPAAAAPAPVANDPQLAARISELAERARAGGRAFAALLPDAQGSVARAGAAGSEPWVQAQQLVSRLEGARSPTADALAELEALAIARSEDAGTSQEDRERVLAAVQEIRALAQAQRAELERLSGQLSSL